MREKYLGYKEPYIGVSFFYIVSPSMWDIEHLLNTVHCMDCLEFMKTLPDKCVDLVLTDPPYKFEVHGRGIAQKRNYMKEWFKTIWSSDEYDIYNLWFVEECIRICKKTNIFVFCNKSQLLDIFIKAKELKLNRELLVFCKTSPTPLTNNQRLPDKEYWVHLFKSMTVYWDYATKKSFFIYTTFKDENIEHPTAKPVHIIKIILNNITLENNTVLDCFAWSWTTWVACKEMWRNYILVEKEPKYVDIINKRLENTTKSLFI